MIQFTARALRGSGDLMSNSGPAKLACPDRIQTASASQMISNAAARTLLRTTARFDRPLDATLAMFWRTGIYPHIILGSGVRKTRSVSLSGAKTGIRSLISATANRRARLQYLRKIQTLGQLHLQWVLP